MNAQLAALAAALCTSIRSRVRAGRECGASVTEWVIILAVCTTMAVGAGLLVNKAVANKAKCVATAVNSTRPCR